MLEPLVDPLLTELADQADQDAGDLGDDGEPESQSTVAANLAADWDLWHTPAGDAFATVPVAEHAETWPIKSQTFKRYVAKQFFEAEGKAINSDALSAALNLMEANALFDGEEHDVHVRVAEHGRQHLHRSLQHPVAGRRGLANGLADHQGVAGAVP